MSAPPNAVTWVLETGVFPVSGPPLSDAVRRVGHDVVEWQDEWWRHGSWPRVDGAVVFHGSLGNAARIRADVPWRPGAWCAVEAFLCSSWYPRAAEWLLHRRWTVVPANSLAANPRGALAALDAPDRVFVRPDSPLKPFSGRVLRSDAISLRALDHGFYYDDASIPVVAAPVRDVRREWRYVVVDRNVVAGCAYAADGRTALRDDPGGAPWKYAADVARRIDPPEDVYVLDVCEAEDGLHLLELNPFSGADLYGCDPDAVVASVSGAALRQ